MQYPTCCLPYYTALSLFKSSCSSWILHVTARAELSWSLITLQHNRLGYSLQSPLSFISPLSCPSLSVCAGDLYSLMSKLLGQSKDIVHIHKYKPSEMQRAKADLVAQIDSLMQKKDLGSPSTTLAFQTREDPVLVRDRVHKFHQLEAMAKPPRSKLLAEGQGGSWMLLYCCHRCWKHRHFFFVWSSVREL